MSDDNSKMKLTFEEAIENHRKMWNWIADETSFRTRKVDKHEYFSDNHIPLIDYDCFCCYFANDSGFQNCEICPIDWKVKNKNYPCEASTSCYSAWFNTDDYESAAKYARQIANLPAKQELMKC